MSENTIQQNIPSGWELKKLSDILDYERPDQYIVKSVSYSNKSKTPVLTANKSFILGYTDEEFGIYKNIPAIIFDDFTTDSKFVDFPFKIKSSAIKILKERDISINLRFVFEKMKSINFQTGSHKRFYISQYQNLKILLPPLEEQQKIAEILGAVDEDIAKTQELIDTTEKLKKGLMQELFTTQNGWEEKSLSDVLDYERPDQYIVKSVSYSNKSKTPVLTANKSFILGYTDEEFGIYKNIPAIIFDDFTTDSKFVDFPFKIKSSAIKILKERDISINLRFVFEKMKSINFQTGSHKRFYISQYQNLKILLPPLEEQQKIADILSSIDEKISVNKRLKEKLILLKKGLMQDLLSGRVRVNIN